MGSNGNGILGGPNQSIIGVNPHYSLTSQYSSLPRRSTAFQRNTPARRSTGIMENQMEYFVPRSVSEFNLSGVGDLALPPPRRTPGGLAGLDIGMSNAVPIAQTQTILLPPVIAGGGVGISSGGVGSGGGPGQQILMKPPREKMVTFEDESTAKTCPHGIPTTPRKSSVVGSDVFM
ncbi:uncharacterized protein LOC129607749 [Condylostylus longicornis]|uniref:uncharacterized protein LOC129607749 n=1 Tax=Condylostylus longicornis TaxID=2530218 RepID=UPI00244DF68B|nr:uncharacterized protein LOC129607749 [Condylostylus longicornis]